MVKYRQYCCDIIELFKTVKGIYNSNCVPHYDFVELSSDLIRTTGKEFSNGMGYQRR